MAIIALAFSVNKGVIACTHTLSGFGVGMDDTINMASEQILIPAILSAV